LFSTQCRFRMHAWQNKLAFTHGHTFTLHTVMNICHKHTITSYYENRKKWEGKRRLTDGLAYKHKHTSRTQHKTEVVFFFSLYAYIFFYRCPWLYTASHNQFLYVVFSYNKSKKKNDIIFENNCHITVLLIVIIFFHRYIHIYLYWCIN